jgi:RHS repeat-associated protein
MTRIARILLAAIITSALLVRSLPAAEHGQRYIVILKQRSGVAPDVASLGGTIDSRQEDQLIVTIPPGALAALKSDPKVRYIERVGGEASADEVLIGIPSDPQPGASGRARQLTPRGLGSTAWDSGAYGYDGAGNIVSIGTDTYLYDGVQRLKQSSTQGTPETYTYDGFGNMTARTNNGNAQMIPSVETSTNRYTGTGYAYNEVGAMTSGALYSFTYDALGQPLSKKYNNVSATQEYYVYTPGDERIGVQRGSWWTWSVRDEGGKVLRQYRSTVSSPSDPALWLEDFVWRDGLLLGSQRPDEMGGRRHFHLDHLGSPRLITSDAGQQVSYHDYYPFGDEHSPIPQEVPGGFDREEPMGFTGQERDYAGGMGGEDGHAVDDMHARYSSPTLGRFLSVDPVEGNPGNPQSLNRYAYVLNNPMNLVDPFGLADRLPTPTNPIQCGSAEDPCSIDVPEPEPAHPPPMLPAWYVADLAEFEAAMQKGFNRVTRPDYFSVSGGKSNRMGTLGSAVAISRSGKAFAGWYAGLTSSKLKGISAQATMAWILGHDRTEDDVDSFVLGKGATLSGQLWGPFGAAVTWGGPDSQGNYFPGNGFALETGLTTPGYSIVYTKMYDAGYVSDYVWNALVW